MTNTQPRHTCTPQDAELFAELLGDYLHRRAREIVGLPAAAEGVVYRIDPSIYSESFRRAARDYARTSISN